MAYKALGFNINELGCFYQKDKTSFKLFSPIYSKVSIIINNKEYQMIKRDDCFELTLDGNFELAKYHYVGDDGVSFKDPFAYCSIDDDSYVLDTNKFISEKIKPINSSEINIYEINIRDFSSSESYNGKYHKKFLALTENNLKIDDYFLTGIDYLKNIGVNYIQLMPIFDYDNDNSEYNWGYNPLAYNYVKKDYVFDDKNLYAYVNELRKVINNIHSKNIKVSFDVVFNHLYNMETDLYKMIGKDVFRITKEGKLANGTYCGNELNSENIFIREYLIEMVRRYIRLFDIDGIRIDLMGILDYETVNNIYKEAKLMKEDFVVYGEGWNMGDVIDEDKRASILNADKINNVAMFNDFYRDTIIDFVLNNDVSIEDVKAAISGSNILPYTQSINYVECHDDYTFYDRLLVNKDEGIVVNTKRCKLAMALVMLSKGTPFIHMGQEFLRTKQKVKNSYNSSDLINQIDWKLRVNNNDICDYLKDLIEIRSQLNINDSDIVFSDYYGILVCKINDTNIIINNTEYDYNYHDNKQFTVIFDENGKTNYVSDSINIPSLSILICK